MRHLGRMAAARGRYEEAERWLTDALAVQEAHLGPEHPRLAPTREALADLYTTWGRSEQAARFRSEP